MERIIFILPVPSQATWSALCFLDLARRLHFFLDVCSVPKTIEFPTKCGMCAVISFLYSEQANRNAVLRFCPYS